MVEKNKTVIASEERDLMGRGFWGDGNNLYLERGPGYTCVDLSKLKDYIFYRCEFYCM